jgi:RNA polymerase sigma factor for flagellar operon FliA
MAALANERAQVLRDAIASLTEREQTILVLLYVKHLQGAEIGRLLGVSESRVSQILSSIRRTLKEHIESYDSMGTITLRRAA